MKRVPVKDDFTLAVRPIYPGHSLLTSDTELFVTCLPDGVTRGELCDMFRYYGHVTNVRLSPEGSFSLVEMESEEAMGRVLTARPIVLPDGHQMAVERA